MNTTVSIQPKLIRLRDAPHYLGMDINRFNDEVRPQLTEIPMGKQGIAFDRLELEDWAEQYISRCGRPSRRKLWDEKYQPDSINVGHAT